MDVHDVGEEYLQFLLQNKLALQRAQKRRGQSPQDWKPRDELYMRFMMTITMKDSRKQHHNMMHTSFVPPSYLPCSTSLAELRPVNIRDLKLETHHRGTYLTVRAITPPNRMTGILVLVEDERSHVIMLQIYQQENESTRAASDIVNVGTVMILKEPFLKVMASGEYGLRIDHVSDVIKIDENDPRRPVQWCPRVLDIERSVETLKIEGNKSMGEGKYWWAIAHIDAGSAALLQQPTTDETQIVKRNRALAFLKTSQFDAALEDINFPNFGSQHSEKALFRAAEALYQLQRFEEARQVLETLNDSFPCNTRALEILERARSRCAEQASGNYNFKYLQAAAKRHRPPQLDHATYLGPVEVRQVPNKGRGLFVTKDVKAGDLLLCEKAFSYAWVEDPKNNHSEPALLLNIETNRGFAGGQADLITTTVQKLHRNPSLGPRFRSLYHGDYKSLDKFTVDGEPIVDTFLVERIMSYNVFGCPVSSLNIYKDVLANKSKKATSFGSCGIWVQASYINHSCVSNVRRSFIGDMMIVRATQDLEADTELTFWYQNPDGISFKKLQEKLNLWGFVCSCALCNDARETKAAVVAKRKRLQAQLTQLCKTAQSRNISTDRFEQLLTSLDNTYTRPSTEVPRLLLWDPQLLLVRIYVSMNNNVKSLEWIGKVLATLGFLVTGADLSTTPFKIEKWGLVIDHLVEVFLHARAIFNVLGYYEDLKRAEEYAKVAYKIIVGESSSFESVHGM